MSLLCVHCHFHQPPRENPYTGLVELEKSALPFENWNERIFRESYLPNLYAHYRIDRRIKAVINNYRHVSYNFTGSLLKWLMREKAWFLQRLKETARNAIASTFNHTILPLDPVEDREVQIVWGIKLYEKVFDRKPEGFWLPELAVDRQSLSLLAKHRIKYTILAPHQVQKRGSFFRYYTPEGHIDLFVYDGELSHQLAFGELIYKMDELIRIVRNRKGITLLAVDGETFGHHKKFGEMGLAYLVNTCECLKSLEEVHKTLQPEGESEINELTSWSCAHGIERWRSDCGCSTGGMPGWHQRWRAPMREALEMVRGRVKEKLFRTLEKFTKDPLLALWDFVELEMGLSKEEYLQKHAKRELSKEEKVELFKSLYAYYYACLSFSSDGWFFADISGIEATKNLLFAKRAMDLLGEPELESAFLKVLSTAPSNLQSYGNGFGVWQKLVLPKVYSPEEISRAIVLLELSDRLEVEGRLGKFLYKVEGFEPWRVRLVDVETTEEFEFKEELKDFEPERVPQPCMKWLLESWSEEYLEYELDFLKDHERLLEDLLSYAKANGSELTDLIKSRVKSYLISKLYFALKEGLEVHKVEELLRKVFDFDLDVRSQRLKLWLEGYIRLKISSWLEEEEVKELVKLIREYNAYAGSYEYMVDLWELQNWAWDNRKRLERETLELLGFEVK